MGKYKAGDKIVLNILSEDKSGYYIIGSNNQRWWFLSSKLDDEDVSEPLTNYICNAEQAKAEGQKEAWELAKNIVLFENDDGYSMDELNEIFDSPYLREIFNLTYSEAAAKVVEWERKKEEICVGDVVKYEGSYGVVVGAGEVYVKGFTSDWTPFQWMKQSCTKTGRHINVDAWLAQIGGEPE